MAIHNAKKQGYHPDTIVAGDEVENGERGPSAINLQKTT